MLVDQTLIMQDGTYDVVPDSISYYWYLDGVLLDTEHNDTLLEVDTYVGHVITGGQIAHKAGLLDSNLNMAS